MLNLFKGLMSSIEKKVDYTVPGANEETHKTCPECDGSGREDLFIDCENCNGTGIVKKSFKEIHHL